MLVRVLLYFKGLNSKGSRHVARYQILALANGLALPCIIPNILTLDAAASAFQSFAIAVLIATFFDAYFNIANKNSESIEVLSSLDKLVFRASIISLPTLILYPVVNLTLALIHAYLANNIGARDGYTKTFFLAPLSQLLSVVAASLGAFIFNFSNAGYFLAAYSVAQTISAYLLVRYLMGGKNGSDMVSKPIRVSFREIFEAVLSRSIIMFTQSGLLVAAPFYFSANDVVSTRLAFAAQNMTRHLNLMPLVGVSVHATGKQDDVYKALWLAASMAILMVPATICLSMYFDLTHVSSVYGPIQLFGLLAASIIVPYSPHILISYPVRSPVWSLSVVALSAIASGFIAVEILDIDRALYAYLIMALVSSLSFVLCQVVKR